MRVTVISRGRRSERREEEKSESGRRRRRVKRKRRGAEVESKFMNGGVTVFTLFIYTR